MPTIALADLLGQPETSAYLRRIVRSGRYGNAYLFHGPPGIGKGTAALAFARAALCDRVPGAAPPPEAPAPEASLFGDSLPAANAAPEAPGDDACGVCPACQKVAKLAHPDLKFLFPVSGDKKEMNESLAETLESMREAAKPYADQDRKLAPHFHVFEYDKAASIRIEQTRDLVESLMYRPYEASRRVVIIRDCDRMREDQYSAMLKAIEEPGAATLWVLTTSRLTRVPATIRSRCQRVRFAPLPESLVCDFLTRQAGIAADDAALLAALTTGSLARALSLRDANAKAQRDAALALSVPARNGDPAGLWKAAQGATRFGKAGREELRRLIEHQQLWLRDLLRVRYGAGQEALVNRDHYATLEKLAPQVDATEVRRRLMALEEALRSIDGNISVDLTLFSTLARIGGRAMGAQHWPATHAGRWDY